MTNEQFVILCLEDWKEGGGDPSYVQTTRRRFETSQEACEHMNGIAPSRMPTYAIVPAVEVNALGYPIIHADEYGNPCFKLRK
jgi:hypothetical protein